MPPPAPARTSERMPEPSNPLGMDGIEFIEYATAQPQVFGALLSAWTVGALLVNLLRVPSIVFAVNKLDAVEDPALAYRNISGALNA